MSKQTDLDDRILELPRNLLGTYTLWKGGHDVKNLIATRTFYRHRKLLLEYGLDISIKAPKEKSNIINFPLERIAQIEPAVIPAEFLESDLYFNPSIKNKIYSIK